MVQGTYLVDIINEGCQPKTNDWKVVRSISINSLSLSSKPNLHLASHHVFSARIEWTVLPFLKVFVYIYITCYHFNFSLQNLDLLCYTNRRFVIYILASTSNVILSEGNLLVLHGNQRAFNVRCMILSSFKASYFYELFC